MYPIALDCGIPAYEYWDLTLQEIKDIVDSKNRMLRREKKERVMETFVLAEVTANRILYGFNSKRSESDLLQPWQFYPDLFEDMSEDMEEKREMLETAKFKAQMDKRIEAWNKRFREEQKDGS